MHEYLVIVAAAWVVAFAGVWRMANALLASMSINQQFSTADDPH